MRNTPSTVGAVNEARQRTETEVMAMGAPDAPRHLPKSFQISPDVPQPPPKLDCPPDVLPQDKRIKNDNTLTSPTNDGTASSSDVLPPEAMQTIKNLDLSAQGHHRGFRSPSDAGSLSDVALWEDDV
jgi:hypothetical protein